MQSHDFTQTGPLTRLMHDFYMDGFTILFTSFVSFMLRCYVHYCDCSLCLGVLKKVLNNQPLLLLLVNDALDRNDACNLNVWCSY